ncbi:MAG TPA: MraY family glycosyltransferase [Armatimonadota bacterium]|jgi:UDP-GlcNAc:undecaprenyl-phosphate GlcNAc-1-phosphate transferase
MNSATQCFAAFGIAMLGAYLLTPAVQTFACHFGAVREPRNRDMHTRVMPLWGGLAIWAPSVLTIVGFLGLRMDRPVLGMLLGATVIALFGLLDDRIDLPPVAQIAAIVAAGGMAICFGLGVRFISQPFGSGVIDVRPYSIPLTLLWIVVVTKAVDFLDGLDGLTAGISAIAAATLALMALGRRQPELALVAASVAGACTGFLRHNFNPARIFMGTVGSQFLGFMLACIALIGLFKTAAAVSISLPLLVLGVPIFDSVYVTTKRAVRGQPIYRADKGHVHHVLVKHGLSQRQAVIVLYAAAICCSLVALWVYTGVTHTPLW